MSQVERHFNPLPARSANKSRELVSTTAAAVEIRIRAATSSTRALLCLLAGSLASSAANVASAQCPPLPPTNPAYEEVAPALQGL